MRVYHLVSKGVWQQAEAAGMYASPSLQQEGFIHASTKEQVLATANRRYVGAQDLLLLVINTDRITVPLVFEDTTGRGEQHPHIYGSLSPDAVVAALPLTPDNTGVFRVLPDGLD